MHTSILRLEAAGLVGRSARNQRVVLVRPTARGRQCLETATRRVRAVEHAALADLSREDERTVRAWLASLAAMTTSLKKDGVRRGEVMNHQARAPGNLERRIHDAERNLFAAAGADVEEFFLELARQACGYEYSRMTRPGGCPAPRRVEAPPSGRRCLRSSVISGCSPWTFPVTACPTRSPSGAGRCASSPAG